MKLPLLPGPRDDPTFGELPDVRRLEPASFDVFDGDGSGVAASSIIGTLLGALLLGIVPNLVLIPALALILLVSAVKLWRH